MFWILVVLLSLAGSMGVVSLGALSELQTRFGFSVLFPLFRTTGHQAVFFIGLSMILASLIPIAMAHGRLEEPSENKQ